MGMMRGTPGCSPNTSAAGKNPVLFLHTMVYSHKSVDKHLGITLPKHTRMQSHHQQGTQVVAAMHVTPAILCHQVMGVSYEQVCSLNVLLCGPSIKHKAL